MNDLSKLLDHFSNNFVGFDQIRHHFSNFEFAPSRISSFPPINIYRERIDPTTFTPEGDYIFELALSGYKPENVEINVQRVKGVNLLTIKSEGTKTLHSAKDQAQWIARGIAGRAFNLSYTLADFVEVKSAVMKDGLLTIRLGVREPVTITTQIPIFTDEVKSLEEK